MSVSAMPPQRSTAAQRAALAAVLLGVALRVWAGLGTDGIYFDDEVLQYLEPAHQLAFGRGVVTWEYEDGARSYVFPGWLAGAMRTLDALGVHHTSDLWRALRVFFALLSTLGVLAAWRLGELAGGPWVGAGAALLTACYAPLLNLAPRLLSDPVSGTLAAWGVWLAARALHAHEGRADLRWAGGLLALASAVRPQTGLLLIAPLGWLLATRRWRDAVALLEGAAPVGLLVGVVDFFTWGTPWHSVVTAVRIQLLEAKAASFGTSPPHAYLANFSDTFDLLFALALVLTVLGLPRSGLAGLSFGLVFVVHSLIAHKEFRFMAPVLPLFMVLLASGARELGRWLGPGGLGRGLGAAAVIALALQNLSEAREQRWEGYNAPVQAALAWVQAQDDVGGVLVTEGNWKAGGAFAVHHDVPVAYVAQPGREDLRPYLTHPFINYVVASPAESGLAAVERAGLSAAGFVEVRREGAWRVFRRGALRPSVSTQ